MTLAKIRKMLDGLIIQPRDILKKPPAWLPPTTELLYNLKLELELVADPLDADALWEQGGQVQNVAKPRLAGLRSALQHHPKTISRKQPGHKFPSLIYEVFTDVAVWISAAVWHEQELSGYERLYVLAEKLEYLHAKDFTGGLYQNRRPHYSIMPLASLERHQVICQFGLGVFIPGSDDVQTGQLTLHTANASQPLPEWWFYHKEAEHLPVKKLVRPAGFYETQYHLLIGKQLDYAAILSPLWIQESDGGHILVNSRNQPNSFEGDTAIIQTQACYQDHGITVCPFHAQANSQAILSLCITPLSHPTAAGQAPPRPPLSNQTFVDVDGEDSRNPLSGFTFVDTDNEELAIDFALYLTALALPRAAALPGKSRHWLMSFDDDGLPADSPEQTCWQLRGDTVGNLDWKMTGANVWQRAALPVDRKPSLLPISDSQQTPLTLQPSPLPASILALYPLPMPTILFPLDAGSYTLGREADISLELLARPDSLLKPLDNSTLNNLRFSREQIAVELQDGDLILSQLSHNAPSYVQQDGVFMPLAAGEAVRLPPDGQLIVGCYVLQFKSLTTG